MKAIETKKMLANKVEVYAKDITPIIVKAESITIATKEDLAQATDILSKLNQFNDKITTEKQRITKPLNEALKVERARWKPLELIYDTAITKLKEKMGVYYGSLVIKQAEQEQVVADKLASGDIDTALTDLQGIETADKSVVSDSGSVSFIEVNAFEVMDLVMLVNSTGDKYILPNEVAIRQAMKEGVELSGVRYYKKQSIRNIR